MFTIAVKQYGEEGKNTENESKNKDENKIENKNEIKNRNEKEENTKEKSNLSEIAKNLNIFEDKNIGDSNIIMSDIIKNTENSEILSQKDNTIKIEVTEKVNEIDSHLIPELKFGR